MLTMGSPSGAFRSWLENNPGNAVIGKAHIKCECPMANFLAANGVRARVDYGVYWVEGDENPRDLPWWAKAFIAEIDRSAQQQEPIIARRALGVLDRVIYPNGRG